MNEGFNIHVVGSCTREIEVTEVVGIEIPHPVVGPWRKDVVALKALVKILLSLVVSRFAR